MMPPVNVPVDGVNVKCGVLRRVIHKSLDLFVKRRVVTGPTLVDHHNGFVGEVWAKYFHTKIVSLRWFLDQQKCMHHCLRIDHSLLMR
jgi:hypothetical protein